MAYMNEHSLGWWRYYYFWQEHASAFAASNLVVRPWK